MALKGMFLLTYCREKQEYLDEDPPVQFSDHKPSYVPALVIKPQPLCWEARALTNEPARQHSYIFISWHLTGKTDIKLTVTFLILFTNALLKNFNAKNFFTHTHARTR